MENLSKFMNNNKRENALKWWENLNTENQYKFIEKYFKLDNVNKSVSLTGREIEDMWLKLNKSN